MLPDVLRNLLLKCFSSIGHAKVYFILIADEVVNCFWTLPFPSADEEHQMLVFGHGCKIPEHIKLEHYF